MSTSITTIDRRPQWRVRYFMAFGRLPDGDKVKHKADCLAQQHAKEYRNYLENIRCAESYSL